MSDLPTRAIALNCPACSKANQEGPACQRCGCELSSLRDVRRAAEATLGRAAAHLRQGNWTAALLEAEQSWELFHTAGAAQCAFLAVAGLRDTAGACRWRDWAYQMTPSEKSAAPV